MARPYYNFFKELFPRELREEMLKDQRYFQRLFDRNYFFSTGFRPAVRDRGYNFAGFAHLVAEVVYLGPSFRGQRPRLQLRRVCPLCSQGL